MTEPTHKKFSIADLLFLNCPCTVTLALRLIGKWTVRDIIAQFQFYSDKCAMTLRKHAYPNILKILQPKTGKFPDKKF